MDASTTEERVFEDPQELLATVEERVKHIPGKRSQHLRSEIERWYGQGKSRAELFAEMNRLLQSDFKGGSITHFELKEGITYIMEFIKDVEARRR